MSTETLQRLTRRQVTERRIADVAAMAAKSFAAHRVAPLWVALPFDGACETGVSAWRCAKPGDCAYAFTLYSVPGRLIVCGDLGTLVLERTYDMLVWARGSIDSIDYFAEKVTREIATEEFDPDMVRAWVHETDQEVLEGEHSDKFALAWRGELRREFLDAAEEGEHEAYRVYHESPLNDGDPPSWDNWKYGFLWQREAIKWFLARWPA
ncbi:MAG TPA: hypothetical protein VGE74_08585 [Gemmata sp.]